MFRKLIMFTLVLCALPGHAANRGDLFHTINQRLSYMEDVALFKARHHKPIEDIEREKVVISKAADSAAQAGLDKSTVTAFFRAQISAAKAIQYRYRADLLSSPTDQHPRDLTAVVRPALIELGARINAQIADLLQQDSPLTDKDWPEFESALSSPYLTEPDKRLLFDSLAAIRLK